jgi:hypothetical protein
MAAVMAAIPGKERVRERVMVATVELLPARRSSVDQVRITLGRVNQCAEDVGMRLPNAHPHDQSVGAALEVEGREGAARRLSGGELPGYRLVIHAEVQPRVVWIDSVDPAEGIVASSSGK